MKAAHYRIYLLNTRELFRIPNGIDDPRMAAARDDHQSFPA